MFKIGDKVVYPMHGAGVINEIEEKTVISDELHERIKQVMDERLRDDLEAHNA